MTKLTLDVILNNLYISFLTPYYKFNLIKSDPNDNKFLNYAVIANAKFINDGGSSFCRRHCLEERTITT